MNANVHDFGSVLQNGLLHIYYDCSNIDGSTVRGMYAVESVDFRLGLQPHLRSATSFPFSNARPAHRWPR